MSGREPLLEVAGLSGGFLGTDGEVVEVLSAVSFAIPSGSSTAIVGESGSGKSLTALSIIGLSPHGFSRTAGRIRFEDTELTALDEHGWRSIRGAEISIVFQDARGALNPVFTVGRQIADVIRAHQGVALPLARRRACELLELVRVPEAERRMKQYPHEFSGGMAQRAMLAMALACEPCLLILDEPTTGLDVTIQADILELLAELKQSLAMTTCLITHDLGVVAQACDHVVVMQQGTVVEQDTCAHVITRPQHPYTRQLIADSRLTEASPR